MVELLMFCDILGKNYLVIQCFRNCEKELCNLCNTNGLSVASDDEQ